MVKLFFFKKSEEQLNVEDQIRISITNYEPRVQLIEVRALPNFDNNQFDVSVSYRIIGIDIPPQELQFVLQPTR